MQGQAARIASQAICYIEGHLHDKLDLDTVAGSLHYSKYHLHRIFSKTVGLTMHDYVNRRQLTEAARLLACSQKPIIEIACMSGYESQQAFSDAFKAMYKTAPAEFRGAEIFYPLQLAIHLKEEPVKIDFTKDDIKPAVLDDVDDWMELVSLAIDGYPRLYEGEYRARLHRYIAEGRALILRCPAKRTSEMLCRIEKHSVKRAGTIKRIDTIKRADARGMLRNDTFCRDTCQPGRHACGMLRNDTFDQILRDEGIAVGIMGFSADTGNIDFLAVHPQYRRLGITKLFLDRLRDELPCGKAITLTTYRAGDRADTGYREEYFRLGFEERELLVEYGYPAQRFVLFPEEKEV